MSVTRTVDTMLAGSNSLSSRPASPIGSIVDTIRKPVTRPNTHTTCRAGYGRRKTNKTSCTRIVDSQGYAAAGETCSTNPLLQTAHTLTCLLLYSREVGEVECSTDSGCRAVSSRLESDDHSPTVRPVTNGLVPVGAPELAQRRC